MTLQIRDVSVTTHQTGQEPAEILQHINCDLQSGQITMLVGKTGAGKSTLLDVMAGLRSPTKGEIYIDGEPLWLTGALNSRVHHQLGVAFQAPEQQLFARNVLAEFTYSLKSHKLPRAEIKRLAEQTLHEFGLSRESLYQSPFHLSQGQRRRVALATTFVTNPHWLLLDEPTAGLDPQGVYEFVQLLRSRLPSMQGGIVIATHDLDTFLPIADKVIFLQQGRLLAAETPATVFHRQDIWDQAGIGNPSAVELAQRVKLHLRPQAISLELHDYDAASAAKAIAAIEAEAKSPSPSQSLSHSLREGELKDGRQQTSGPGGGRDHKSELSPVNTENGVPRHSVARLIRTLDPRAKWLAYILVSIGILTQSNWPGILVSTALTIAVATLSRLRIRSLFRMMLPFGFLLLVSTIVSGLVFRTTSSPWHLWIAGVNALAATSTFEHLYRFLLVMILGLVLSATTSQLMMKQGLEQALQGLKKLKLPVEAFSLATSLALRFIPVIMSELERFTRIAKARGKSHKTRGGIPLREVPAVVLPLLLSVLHIGDQLSNALEARGYHTIGQPRTQSIRLKFGPAEWKLIGSAIVVLGLLLLVGRIA